MVSYGKKWAIKRIYLKLTIDTNPVQQIMRDALMNLANINPENVPLTRSLKLAMLKKSSAVKIFFS